MFVVVEGNGRFRLQRDGTEEVWGVIKLLCLDFGGRSRTRYIYQNLVLYATEGKFYWM